MTDGIEASTCRCRGHVPDRIVERRMTWPSKPGSDVVDLTVVAVPGYFAAMGLEYAAQRRRLARGEPPSPGDYERRDTLASLAMGSLSLLAPFVMPRLLRPITPGRGRFAKAAIAVAVGAAVVTTAADAVARREVRLRRGGPGGIGTTGVDATGFGTAGRVGTAGVDADGCAARNAPESAARRVAAAGGVVALAAGGAAITTAWATATTPERLWRRRLVPSLGNSKVSLAAALVGWDFIYYWNHRFMHTSRFMWAVHEVHHSSERYNLSTALRQPVADALGTSLPYGLLCLFGVPPDAVATARGVNLIYQFWIHTEAVDRIGRAEQALNTPSHHRVHHGSNRQYLDRNHAGILIIWDRMFGTFEPEDQHVVYGLTTNIDTFDPTRIASHEYIDMARDVASATGWVERLSYVLRGPGWSMRQRAAAGRTGHAFAR
jgi:sterol desaturase/sphingolipid hydroxylase (fatty acid hydroxylase superfamily)